MKKLPLLCKKMRTNNKTLVKTNKYFSFMNFSKFRNSGRIQKILLTIILINFVFTFSFSQTTPTTTPTGGTTQKEKENTDNTPKQQTPVNKNNAAAVPTGINTEPKVNRVPGVDINTTRTAGLTQGEIRAITKEDSIRMAKEAELAEDLRKSSIRKRIFGYTLFSNVKFDPNATLNIPTPNNYVLGANDKLVLDIYGYSQYTQDVTVNPDGYVTLYKAGLVKVSGLTIEEAEAKIKNAFSKIFLGLKGTDGFPQNTFLKISLASVRAIKVNITGEVIAPGTYTVTSLTSVLNALYACGGPNEIGSYRNIKIIRGNRVISTLDLYDIIVKGHSKDNVLLRDQDIIQVPPFVSRVAAEGNLKRKGLFEVLPTESLEQTLNFAGGFDQYAYTDRIKVYRNTTKERKILDIENRNFKSFLIQSGDSVVVEKLLDRFENLVSIEGAVFRPGEYSLDSNQDLLSLIKNAEGLRGDALSGRIIIIRTNEDLSVGNLSVSLDNIKTGKSPNLELKREDRIIIPSIFDLTEVSTVRIQGAINNPDAEAGVEIPYIKNMTIEDVIVRVGGLTEAASLSRIEVVRRKRNVDPTQANAQVADIFEFNINADFSVEAKLSNFTLLPFDEIFVRTSPNYEKQTYVTLQGEVIYPGIYGIKNKDEKISNLIERAGGLTAIAYTSGATLLRKVQLSDYEIQQRQELIEDIATIAPMTDTAPTAQIKEESIGIDLEKIMKNPNSIDDIILRDGDVISIPKRLQTVRIQGEVLYPTTVKFLPGFKFIDYISKSGGYTRRSLKNKSFVLYPNGSIDRTRRFLFVNIYPKIEPGSEIIIPAKSQNAQQQLSQLSTLVTTISSTLATIVTIVGILQLSKR